MTSRFIYSLCLACLTLCGLFSKVDGNFAADLSLAERATNPITDLNQLQCEDDFTTANYRSSGCSNTIYIKPLIPLDATALMPLAQLLRIKLQLLTIPKGPDSKYGTFLGDTQFFDLFVIEENWGRVGLGPMAIFPTATALDAGHSKWQLGPAFAISYLKYPKWQFGFLMQNPISFAGRSKSSHQNTMYFQPLITRHFEHGWYLSSNGEWTIDWIHGEIQIPINVNVGRVFSIGEQKIDASLVGELMAYQHCSGVVPLYTLKLCVNFLHPASK